LTSITNLNPNPPVIEEDNAFSAINRDRPKLYVPGESLSKYKRADVWKEFTNMIVLVDSIRFTEHSIRLDPGISKQLKLTVYPFDATTAVTWLSDNEDLVTISGNGTVTAKNKGKAWIYVTTKDDGGVKTDSCQITIVSSDAALKNLTVNHGELVLVPPFNPEVTVYSVVVRNSVSKITIEAEQRDTAVVDVSGDIGEEKDLPGNTTSVSVTDFTVSVTAEDNVTVRNYTVHVTKLPLSSDATLDSLKINGDLIPGFNPAVTHYETTVEGWEVEIYASSPAGATISGNGMRQENRIQTTVPLDAGENTIELIVTSENGAATMTYTIIITCRPSAVTDIPHVGGNAAGIYFRGQILHVNSPAAEKISIYSVTGALLYRLEKPAGKTSFAVNLPKQTLIVTGSSGWREKLIKH
jgi:hypothetical protein